MKENPIDKTSTLPKPEQKRPEIYNPSMLSDLWRQAQDAIKLGLGKKLPGSFPFSEELHPENLLATGTKWLGEWKVYEFFDQWVLKVPYTFHKNTFRWLREEKGDYEWLVKRFGDYIPPTYFMRGHDAQGRAINMCMQKRIYGRTLWEIPPQEYLENPEILKKVVPYLEEIVKSWEEEGRTPDIAGTPVKERRQHPLAGSNIMVEDETCNVYHVDVAAPKATRSREALPHLVREIEDNIAHIRHFLELVKNDPEGLKAYIEATPRPPNEKPLASPAS